MTRTRLQFEPLSALPGGLDPVTKQAYLPRLSTTDEQQRQAVDFGLDWMRANRVWTVEVEVAWTRRDATVLVLKGHAEHLGPGEIVPVLDEAVEQDAEGRVIVTSLAEQMARLEAEVEAIYDEGLA